MSKSGLDIITVKNLSNYFYTELSELNRKSLCPLPEHLIYYSSDVLEEYSLTSKYFEMSEDKVREKVLGLKLLEVSNESAKEKIRVYKEVGDTALVLLGCFSHSINKKILDENYYFDIGMMAYTKLNAIHPLGFDIPSFYKIMSTSFERVVTLVKDYSKSNQRDPFEHLIIKNAQ